MKIQGRNFVSLYQLRRLLRAAWRFATGGRDQGRLHRLYELNPRDAETTRELLRAFGIREVWTDKDLSREEKVKRTDDIAAYKTKIMAEALGKRVPEWAKDAESPLPFKVGGSLGGVLGRLRRRGRKRVLAGSQ